MNLSAGDVMRTAGALLSDQGENVEYDRAIVELTCDLLGISTDCRDEVLALLQTMH